MKLKIITPIVQSAVMLTLIGFGFSPTAYTKNSKVENSVANSQLMQEVVTLRKQGASGLDKFLKNHAQELQKPSPQIREALDKLCQQRDCYASKLYWYTDLEQAKAAAKASGKPILSLRLLGRLDQDLSCANSRFFRVALYPNAAISQELRDRFILHWQSVRPAPKITIDYGDGRKLERTITGNSIHYILDASGRPIDAIPGLYGPNAFLSRLQISQKFASKYNQVANSDRNSYLQKYHQASIKSNEARLGMDLKKLGIANPPKLTESIRKSNATPNAAIAGRIAITKSRVELPVISRMEPSATPEIVDRATWDRIAQLYVNDVKLDQNSLALIQSKKFYSNNKSPNSLQRVVNNFETAMALDTVRNEYMLRTQINQWFVEGRDTNKLEQLNKKVYSQLFLTPNSDPWLGLLPSDTYSAIDNDGISK
ncbi:hypothetical protein [Brunnivagina elsteri]|uniref:Uncharacterized protein n=1 Tax=Brunnivagina elsteri CCALA 953 TaxID=987040 RepID=A0A2A2TKE2_9CYAN|nr:hypothetical protein [Calothrix elsteri]PAX56977.1 hypothetical protein CK510_09740 [Calothrix elsteri CCALA 953]